MMKEIQLIRTLYPFIRAYKWVAIAIVGLGILSSLAEGIGISLLIPLLHSLDSDPSQSAQQQGLVALLNSSFAGFSDERRLVMIAIAIAIAILVKNVLAYTNKTLFSWFTHQVGHQIRAKIFNQLLQLHYSYLEAKDSGQLLNLLATESWQVIRALEMLVNLMVSICVVAVFTILLLLLSWRLMLLISILMLLISLIIRYVTQQAQLIGHRAVKANTILATLMCEGLMGMRTIRAFNREEYEQHRFDQASQQVKHLFWRLELLYGLVDPLHEGLATFLIIGVLVWSLLNNPSSLSTILTFMFMLYRVQPQIKLIDTYRVSLMATDGSITVVLDFISHENKPYQTSGHLQFQGLQDEILLDQVSFQYENQGQDDLALHDISLRIPKGKVTALVGPSGAGKSTLINLICCFYDATTGQIYVDQAVLNHFSLESWRSRIAIVSQDIHLFSASIRDNIAYGRLDATDIDIIEAAKRANAHDFIMQLEGGYDHLVGDRGLLLSGGQRQRLALARAIVRDPEILILDEATNALDTRSEHLIQAALAEFSRDRTVIVIAHRLSTIEQADQIVVLDQGQIVERGNLSQLLQNQGLFHQLYQLQYSHALSHS